MMDWKKVIQYKLGSLMNEPSWLIESRKESFVKFNKLGIPSRKDELWKYANTKRLEEKFENQLKPSVIEMDSEYTQLIIDNSGFKIIKNNSNDIKITDIKKLDK